MIGHYVRHIKSRKHPEKNVMTRMVSERSVLLQQLATVGCRVFPGVDSAEEDGVAPSSTNSSLLAGSVHWPTITKNNSHLVHHRFKCLKPDSVCCVDLLKEYLGARRYAELRTAGSIKSLHVVSVDSSKVQIGAWTYATTAREARTKHLKTTQAWFAIQARHVHRYFNRIAEIVQGNEEELKEKIDSTPLFYGRFKCFLRVTVEGLAQTTFSFGRCDIYRGRVDPITQLATIDMDPNAGGVDTWVDTYIKLTNVLCPIARGPVFTGWPEFRADSKAPRPQALPHTWIAMPIFK
ncbi:hypothetical protein [Silvimonas sp.]|uniref:hypothetical protein n=1 Tax=Silvimonas sp. TaxID=2650811 RepID=UPI0028450CBD|nr:hypothetical protein [Silvimonas sp.]MDR3427876.1 hypothetical protein [Silvimonas sp.]